MESEREGALSDLYRYSGLGVQFAATVILLALGGLWLDRRAGTSPWLLLVGVFLGFGLGLYSMVKKLPRLTGKRPPDDPLPPR